MIVRAPNRRRWVAIDNRAIEDSRLSCRAKGLLAYLLSRPDNWRASPSHLETTCSDSAGMIRATLKELEHFGYATLRQVRSADGRQAMGTEWVIAEIPETRDSGNVNLRIPTPNKYLEENKDLKKELELQREIGPEEREFYRLASKLKDKMQVLK